MCIRDSLSQHSETEAVVAAAASACLAEYTPAAEPEGSFFDVLRQVTAEAAVHLHAGELVQVNALYRDCAQQLASEHEEMAIALQNEREARAAAGHVTVGERERYIAYNVYRRAFDTMLTQGRQMSSECFLYFWDERDGETWMGWWITPQDVGCMRYWAHAPGSDTDTPDPVSYTHLTLPTILRV